MAMENIDQWLTSTRAKATLISEGYRLALSRLWWANLMFVVVPAVLSTAAAVVAALPENKAPDLQLGFLSMPPASAFAGLAAVLLAIHKALKCDEHQTECQRLGQLHQAIAIQAGSALSRPEGERAAHQERIASRLEEITENAKARLSTGIIQKAEERCGVKLIDHGMAFDASTMVNR
jgi:hypothetical protein